MYNVRKYCMVVLIKLGLLRLFMTFLQCDYSVRGYALFHVTLLPISGKSTRLASIDIHDTMGPCSRSPIRLVNSVPSQTLAHN